MFFTLPLSPPLSLSPCYYRLLKVNISLLLFTKFNHFLESLFEEKMERIKGWKWTFRIPYPGTWIWIKRAKGTKFIAILWFRIIECQGMLTRTFPKIFTQTRLTWYLISYKFHPTLTMSGHLSCHSTCLPFFNPSYTSLCRLLWY